MCYAFFSFSNIIETPDGFCLIDWRQDFAGDLEVGDVYYDLAKLNHNLIINHDLINKNLFDPSPDNCYVLTHSTLNECRELLHSFIKENGYDLKKVEILSSCLFSISILLNHSLNSFGKQSKVLFLLSLYCV